MKQLGILWIASGFVFGAQAASAQQIQKRGPFRCTAQCVVMDSIDNRIYVVDTALSLGADAERGHVFEALKAHCRNEASELGLPAEFAHLLASIEFHQSSEEEYQHSETRERSYWRSVFEWKKSRWVVRYSHSSLWVKYQPAAATSQFCPVDRSIPRGTEIPWMGSFPELY